MNIIIYLFNIENQTVNPWTLMLIGMGTVFGGLLLLNFIINMLKLITNPKNKDAEDYSEIEELNKAIFENVPLSEDEVLATSLSISIEYDLYYSDEKCILTIKNKDKEPTWINSKRR